MVNKLIANEIMSTTIARKNNCLINHNFNIDKTDDLLKLYKEERRVQKCQDANFFADFNRCVSEEGLKQIQIKYKNRNLEMKKTIKENE